ncbi:MAG: hypothetical protein F6K40_36335 [Okeania sp. SIO3I5]|uniref:hypothetical protein n=1 Tax=Okeania sp. SIO3I5 TaxID=2607805 RepID=UPI0013B79E92|nr:hypothetical protein [Okeania sp. SIO3I5]NEQ41371.1 hypothetical protein [Okeania sp. SIO3I5]
MSEVQNSYSSKQVTMAIRAYVVKNKKVNKKPKLPPVKCSLKAMKFCTKLK